MSSSSKCGYCVPKMDLCYVEAAVNALEGDPRPEPWIRIEYRVVIDKIECLERPPKDKILLSPFTEQGAAVGTDLAAGKSKSLKPFYMPGPHTTSKVCCSGFKPYCVGCCEIMENEVRGCADGRGGLRLTKCTDSLDLVPGNKLGWRGLGRINISPIAVPVSAGPPYSPGWHTYLANKNIRKIAAAIHRELRLDFIHVLKECGNWSNGKFTIPPESTSTSSSWSSCIDCPDSCC